MANYKVEKINFSSTPSGIQTGTLSYKQASQPASDYVVVNSSVQVDTDGTVLTSPPLTITGLTSGVLYNVMFSNNCSSPVESWVINITAP
jgi:hypothetical protein